MKDTIKLTWTDVFERLNRMSVNYFQAKRVYGVPNGGMILSGFLRGSTTTDPTLAEVILDDIEDSGETRKYYESNYPSAQFIPLFNSNEFNGKWVSFPWERQHPAGPQTVEGNITRLLQHIGEDPNRDGLKDTPKRVIKSYKELFSGYGQDPKELFKTFEGGQYDSMVLLKDIEIYSMCLVGSTFVETPRGRIPIKYLKNGDWVYTVDPKTLELDVLRCVNPRLTQKNANLLRVYTDNDSILCTPNHKFLTFNKGWVQAQDLKAMDSIVSLYRTVSLDGRVSLRSIYNKKDPNEGLMIEGRKDLINESRFVFGKANDHPIRSKKGRYKIIHHKDEIPWNNLPDNLEGLVTVQQHNEKHNRFNGELNSSDSPFYEKRKKAAALSSGRKEVRTKRAKSVKSHWDTMSPEEREKRRVAIAEGIRLNRNHKVIGVEKVEWKEDVYCLDVPGTHTFFANGMAVHNCEHHMLPFYGKAHVAYIPTGVARIVGISKLARLVDLFARRLQIQERIGEQVTDAIMEYLQPKGAACVIQAVHMCMCARGVGKQNSVMVTSSVKGEFLTDPTVRQELMNLI